MKQILMILILAAMLWIWMGNGSSVTADNPSGGDCLASIQAQYSGQWAQMSAIERAFVGLSAAGCDDAK